MKVLLLDDKMDRSQDIEQILNDFGMEIKNVHSLEGALSELKKEKYAIVIIDLFVPLSYSDRTIDSKAGFECVKYIFESIEQFNRPQKVIVVSENFNDITYMKELKLYPISLIDTSLNDWIEDFTKTINHFLIKVKPVDIAIVTAVDIEFETVLNSFRWEKDLQCGPISFYRTVFKNSINKSISLLLVKAERKGMLPTSIAVTKLFENYQPEKVFMLGICAGNPAETNSCDIIIATSSCDYSNGAMFENDNNDIEFSIEPSTIEISNSLKAAFIPYSSNRELAYKLRSSIDYEYNKDISIKTGTMACGPFVLKSSNFIDKYIQPHNRKYFGIDMESYALYYTCKNYDCNEFLVIKSVSDHGNIAKSDEYQKFCVKLTIELLKHYISTNI